MSGILQVFPVTSGAGANTQNSEGMWNWWGRLFAAVFVAVILVAVSVFVAVISVADLPL
jgi:hypothetical protein